MSNQEIPNFGRDSRGLLVNEQYAYKPDGRIDWRKMVKKEHVVVQDQKKKEFINRYGKELSEMDLSEVDDKYLLILLPGLEELAKMRGYDFVQHHVDYVDEGKAVVTCTIRFIGNFETGGQPVCFSSVASATAKSTSGIFQFFLESIAENRALARAIRKFLGINILGQDEIVQQQSNLPDPPETPTTSSEAPSFQPHGLLADRAKKKGMSFDLIKKACVAKYKSNLSSDPETWTGFDSINRSDAFFIIGKLDEKKD